VNIALTVRIALRAIFRNKLRAGLTVLGVVIGIAAVTTMVSVGQSASGMVMGELESFGTNFMFVTPAQQRRGGVSNGAGLSLTAEDCVALPKECSAVFASSPLVAAGGQLIYRNANWSPKEMFGVGVDYLMVRAWAIEYGEFFTNRDIESASKVCVIGRSIARKLFQTTNPLGKTIRVRNIPFRIIGILEEKGAGMTGDDQDDIVLLPYTTVQKRLTGSMFKEVHAIVVSAVSKERIDESKNQIEQLLRDRHGILPGQKADFQVVSSEEIAGTVSMITGTMTALLAAIAGISLLVGGVGIMNIMLVSVTERTREIGIRMAVGARGGDILRQFLIESVILSLIGGIIGVSLGYGASIGIITLINTVSPGANWPIEISFVAAVIALAFASVVGMFFGFYPARQASKLDPIDALRYE
jgi:putative ABC transport system permease protein